MLWIALILGFVAISLPADNLLLRGAVLALQFSILMYCLFQDD